MRAYPVSHEILRKPVATDRFTFSGKARIIKIAEDQNAIIDSLTACKFIFFGAGLEEYAGALSAVTGVAATAQDLLKVGERIYNLERMFNQREGFGRKDDTLPSRFLNEPLAQGASSGKVVPLEGMLDEFYDERGWDSDGNPTEQKKAELGL